MSDFQEISQRLVAGVRNLQAELPKVIADPRSHPQEALALAGIAAVTLLLLVLVGVLVLDAVQRGRDRRALGVRRSGRGRLRLWVWSAAAVVVALVVVGLAPLVPASGKLCGRCHAVSAAVRAWESDVHAGASCYACHARPGVLGALQASGSGLSRVMGTERTRSTESGSCLHCHESLRRGVVETASVRVRHSDLIAAGMDCLVCHPQVGHDRQSDKVKAVAAAPEESERASRPTSERSVMGRCLLCHDGDRAPAECDTCHLGSTLDRATEVDREMPALTHADCGGCHSQKLALRCRDCHGLDMPHPADFLREHARLSSQDPEVCVRCHESASPTAACACHLPGERHGDLSAWFARHSTAALEMWPGGCRCHSTTDCAFCHQIDERE